MDTHVIIILTLHTISIIALMWMISNPALTWDEENLCSAQHCWNQLHRTKQGESSNWAFAVFITISLSTSMMLLIEAIDHLINNVSAVAGTLLPFALIAFALIAKLIIRWTVITWVVATVCSSYYQHEYTETRKSAQKYITALPNVAAFFSSLAPYAFPLFIITFMIRSRMYQKCKREVKKVKRRQSVAEILIKRWSK